MDIVKMITGNKSIQNVLLNKLTEKAKESGHTKFLIDLEKPEIELQFIDHGKILVDETQFNFYKGFYEQNKETVLIKSFTTNNEENGK